MSISSRWATSLACASRIAWDTAGTAGPPASTDATDVAPTMILASGISASGLLALSPPPPMPSFVLVLFAGEPGRGDEVPEEGVEEEAASAAAAASIAADRTSMVWFLS